MEKRNYEEFDYMRILVKNDFFDEVMKSYSCFGWEIHEIIESNVFSETKEVVLKRKHKMPKKDRLQLLQVYMENSFFELSKLERTKYLMSIVMGLSVGILATALICFFIFFASETAFVYGLVLSIIMACLGGFVLIRLLFALKTIKKIEEIRFGQRRVNIFGKIYKFCLEAEEILAEENKNGKD